MKKYVTGKATFVVYAPAGWTVAEAEQPGFRILSAADPTGELEAAMFCGTSPVGDDLLALARRFTGGIARQYPDFQVLNPMVSPDGVRLVFDGTYTHPQKGGREFRCWISERRGDFTYHSIEGPAGRLDESRALLLTILANARVMNGAFDAGGAAPVEVPLYPYRLADGSATIQIPQGWNVQATGGGTFVAADPSGAFSFIVGGAEVLTPQLGVNVPGAFISPYRPPHRALEFLATRQGAVSGVEFEEVIPRPDVARQIAQVYTVGTVEAEEFVYTFNGQAGRGKGYSFGICFGSRLGVNWRFWHISVAAPAELFDRYVPTMTAMVQSYRIDDQFAMNYIQQGMARLRQLQQQTAAMVARNAREISEMMTAAYDERQRSQDYIDYQRTSTIRGESDWISGMEGGAVYHSDSWGTKNQVTGESWEGAPFNYVHFEGRNPKYNEDMTPVNDRATWQRAFGR